MKIFSSETARDINLNFMLEVLWAKAYTNWLERNFEFVHFCKVIGLYNGDLAISIKIFSSETARDNNLDFYFGDTRGQGLQTG